MNDSELLNNAYRNGYNQGVRDIIDDIERIVTDNSGAVLCTDLQKYILAVRSVINYTETIK